MATHCCLTELLLLCARAAGDEQQRASAATCQCGSKGTTTASCACHPAAPSGSSSCTCHQEGLDSQQQLVSINPDELLELDALHQRHLQQALPLLVGQPPANTARLRSGVEAVHGRLVKQVMRWHSVHLALAQLRHAVLLLLDRL